MMGWGWGWSPFHFLVPVVFLVVLLAGVILLVRSGQRDQSSTKDRERSAIDLLDERYARGEIDREEYLQKKADISGS